MDESDEIRNRAAIFQSLERAFEETGSVDEMQKSLVSGFGLSTRDVIEVMQEFIVAKIASQGTGEITHLPEFDDWPVDPNKQKRLASWTWFYVHRVYGPGAIRGEEKLREDLLFRTHFEFGNNDEDSEHLLKWANEHPGMVLDLLEKSINAGLLSDYHRELLSRARSKLTHDYLAQIHPERDKRQT